MAGDQQRADRVDELVLGERVARRLGGDHPAEQPVLGQRPRAQALVLAGEVRAELEDRLLRREQRLEVGPVAALESEQAVGQRPEEQPVGVGDAEQVAEDGDGQRAGEVLDHIHSPVGLDPVEEVVDDAPHVRAAAPRPALS